MPTRLPLPRLALLPACGLMLLGLLLLPAPQAASAQMFTYGMREDGPTQSLSAAYTLIDFSYNGDAEPSALFAFSEPVYGVAYTRPNFHATFAYGTQPPAAGSLDAREMRLLDASLTTWGELNLMPGAVAEGGRLFVPIAIHSNYRRVSPEGSENSLADAFNVTVLGLGVGAGFEGRFGDRVVLEARALPVIGLALRQFNDSAGSARLLDTDVQLHLGRLIDRFGLSVGYGFRTQVWNVSASELLAEADEDFFDYRGRQHTFRVGVNW